VSGLRVREAVAEDFLVVAELLAELGRAEVTAETREQCRRLYGEQVADLHACHLVAEDAGTVIAFCALHFRGRLNYPSRDAWIPDLIVTAAARRRGAARALIEAAERIARERGCWQLTLESGYGRAEAHLLYAACGMADKGKYFGKRLT